MKKIIFSDLHDRVQQTLQIKRRRLSGYDDDGNLIPCYLGYECFEFLIFLEIKDQNGNFLLHHPVAIGHEPYLKETMQQLLLPYRSLASNYRVSAVAIENSLVRFGEWKLFDPYQIAEDLFKTILEEFGEASGGHLSGSFNYPENIIEKNLFYIDGSEPLPLVKSLPPDRLGKIRRREMET